MDGIILEEAEIYGRDATAMCRLRGGRDGRKAFLLPQFTFAFNSLSAFRIQLFSCHITLQAHNDHSSSSSYAFCKSLSSMTTRVFKFYLFRRMCRLRHRRKLPGRVFGGKAAQQSKSAAAPLANVTSCAQFPGKGDGHRHCSSQDEQKLFAGPRFSFSRYGENVRFEQCTAKGYKIEEIVAQTSARV